MISTFADVLEKLEQLKRDPYLTSPIKDEIRILQVEVRFLKMFFWCFATCKDVDLRFSRISVDLALQDATTSIDGCLSLIYQNKHENLIDLVSRSLHKNLIHCKEEIRKICVALLERSSELQFYETHEMVEFLDCILKNLQYLASSKADRVLRLKEQIGAWEEKLMLFRSFLVFAEIRCNRHVNLTDLLVHTQAWINTIACQSILLWTGWMDQNNQKVMEIYCQRYDNSQTVKVVGSYIDVFFQILPASMGDYNHIEIQCEGLIFLIVFLVDLPKKGYLTPIGVTVHEATILMDSILSERTNEQIAKDRVVLSWNIVEILLEINKVKAKAREFYSHDIHKLRWTKSPLTNGVGFIDSLLDKLKDTLEGKAKVLSFERHQVGVIQKELKSFRPALDNILQRKNDHEELSALWTQIVNVAYRTGHVIDSCLIGDGQIIHRLMCLSDVIEEIKLIKNEVRKIKDKEVCIRNISDSMSSSSKLPNRANTSNLDETVVGFKDVAETIMDKRRGGSARRDIVTIVGMAGQGKTTLAKKIYNDPLIQYDFHISAWCCISQVYKRRKLLLDILSHIVPHDAINTKSDEDLGERLWKCLKGHKYLIVIDDIWESRAWYDIERFFPDDNNGSRMMFTSRIHDVALQVKPDSKPLHLRPLSNEESWELLEKRLLEKGDGPSHLSEVGEHIVKLCKGLPLAIVAIAGLLTSETHNKINWKQISEHRGSRIASEEYMDILELSYTHLPDHLRPCFLYFGALPEDKVISAQKFIKLWIAEGFVRRTGTKRLEDVAKEYLIDLARRSLVIVSRRSSTGGIKTCCIHDLFRDLCLAKAKEEYFFQLVSISGAYDSFPFSPNPINDDHYRLMIHGGWDNFIESKPNGHLIHSLLFFATNPFNQFPCSNISMSINSFKHLKVLYLGSIFFGGNFPNDITVLVLLRYLEICGNFRDVPSSVANLQNLETFLVKSVTTLALPASIWRMKRLRHMDIKPDFVFASIRPESPGLYNLEVLSSPRISLGRGTAELFRRLPAIRKLSCIFVNSQSDFDNVSQDQPFGSFRSLESLKIAQWGASGYEFDQLRAVGIPRSLKKLTLSRLGLPWWATSGIGQLPSLEVLKLREDAFAGTKWDVEDVQFPNLKHLELYNLNIEKWINVSTESFPCLQGLVLRHCYRLEEIPCCFGDIPTLKMIEVCFCSEKVTNSAKRILCEQLDMGNEDLEVLIS